MRNLLRWLAFTAAVALIGLAIAFGLLFLGRLYLGFQQTALVFTILMLYSIGVTIASISYAAKLEREGEREGTPVSPTPTPSGALTRAERADA